MFFLKSVTVFHKRLFRTNMSLFYERYHLYYRQMVAQIRINKETRTFYNCFNYFVLPLQMY